MNVCAYLLKIEEISKSNEMNMKKPMDAAYTHTHSALSTNITESQSGINREQIYITSSEYYIHISYIHL